MIPRILASPIKTALSIIMMTAIIIILITANWEWISSVVAPNIKIGLYSKNFWENFLVEMHGMLVELALVGGLLLWLDNRRRNNNVIKEHQQLLIDYAELDFPEANLKKLTSLKGLNSSKIFIFKVHNMAMRGMPLHKIEFHSGSKLIGLKVTNGAIKSCVFNDVSMRSCNFAKSEIISTQFTRCNLYKSNFVETICKGVSFERAKVDRVDFTGANLKSAIFKNADIREAKFHNATLDGCSFSGAENIDVAELAKAKSLDYIALDRVLLLELIKIRPDMKYQRRVVAGPEGIEPSGSHT
jgi:uncharacterized protein YjbI with pentapeptide repeats